MIARQFLVDHLEGIAYYGSLVAAVPGAAALGLVLFRWSWLSKRYREYWAKCAVASFRAVAALSAVVSKFALPTPGAAAWEQPWVSTVVIAGLGYLFWELVGALGDHKAKLAKEKIAADYQTEICDLRQDRDEAEYQGIRLGWLLAQLRNLTNDKRQRIRRVVQQTAGARPSVQHARAGLDPEGQIQFLFECLALLFRMHAIHEDSSRHNQNFRVGLFAERDGRLVPLAAFDLVSRSHNPFSSYTQYADRYRIDNGTDPAHAVRCVREGRTLIVPDCASEPGFYFHERQPSYLRSMIAHPLEGFCPDGFNPALAALLVDTDAVNFFQENDREMLELLLREFAARINLEYAIRGLTG
ncbi:hypothetical protein R5W23_001010 [Gemmata sp. JC673]|uniref:GAF domain-containing protein n=1 Tax=Gemmata algarum TaxID=2975278 RepID=A0ABU5EY26_9BACT|nr:hypothetical protein [Gemmata algarum]MDY3559838.1 hypothetical protein [Gemmata algarum]